MQPPGALVGLHGHVPHDAFATVRTTPRTSSCIKRQRNEQKWNVWHNTSQVNNNLELYQSREGL